MKNLSKTKLNMGKLLVCTLMVALVFQLSSLSLVQATSEPIPRTNTNDGSLYDSVSINNDETVTFAPVDTNVPVLISTEDGPMILEDTINNQEDIQTVLPDDAIPYNPEDKQIDGRELISAPALISTEDDPMIIGNTTDNQEDIQTMLPDYATPYNPEDQQLDGRELISGLESQPVLTAGYVGLGVLLGIVAIAAIAFVAKRSKKSEQ